MPFGSCLSVALVVTGPQAGMYVVSGVPSHVRKEKAPRRSA